MIVNAEKSFIPESDLPVLQNALHQRLEQLLPEAEQQDSVRAAMRAATLAPGRRMRPLLLLLAAHDFGCEKHHPGVLDFACAIEMIHAASLMLDDIPCMDNALLRRGRPTIHRQFGQHVTILAAIALLSDAFGLAARAEGLSATCRTQAVAELSMATGLQGLVRGQFEDLHEGSAPRAAEAIARTNDLKTSMLFNAALQMAALAANLPTEAHQMVCCFSRDLGQAFQLLDDLTDGRSGTGKDTHQDVGKSTLVALLGKEAVQQRLHAHLHSADSHFARICRHGRATRHFIHHWFQSQLTTFG